MKKKKIILNLIVKNTLILILCSLLVKALGLFNRVILTRMMGNDGISLYIIVLPTISLFMSLAGFSLNVALSKIVAENNITKKYSNKAIFHKAIIIGLISSALMILLLLGIASIIANDWLKQPDSFYPIIACCSFLPLVAMNNIVRGYYNGLNKINISAYISVIEQIVRITCSIIFIILFSKYGLIVCVTAIIFSMGVGEAISLLFSIILLKLNKQTDYESSNNPTKAILSTAVPTTLSRLAGNLTYFLEPIIYTAALMLINYSSEEVMYKYSEVNAYAIPLITMFTFVSTSIATAIIPNIAKQHVNNNESYVKYLIKKAIMLSLLPGILITVLLTTYSYEAMELIYKTTIGAEYVKKLSALFLLFYIQPPLVASLQAIGEASSIFKISLITNIIKLVLIFSLTFIPYFSYLSLIVAMLISSTIATLICYFTLKNKIHFTFKVNEIISLVIVTIFVIVLVMFLKSFISSFILVAIITSIIYLVLLKMMGFTSFEL